MNSEQYIKYFLLLIALVLISLPAISQKQIPQNPNRYDADGSKKGKWTVLYNEDEVETNDPSETTYYRLITYKKGVIEGEVSEYYKSGVLKWEGYLTSDTPDSLKGINKWYHAEGTLASVLVFENDQLDLESSKDLQLQKPKDVLTIEQSLEFYAGFLVRKERHNEAISVYKIVLNLFQETSAKPSDMARIFQSTGNCWLSMKEYINALSNFQLIPQISEKEEDLFPALMKSGECLIQLALYDSAKIFLLKSQEIQQSLNQDKTSFYAATIDQTGLVMYYLKDYTNAIKYFKKTLNLLKTNKKQLSVEYIQTLYHISLAYSMAGFKTEAVKSQKLAVTIAGKVYDKGSANNMYVSIQLAKIYLNCELPELALKEALPSLRYLRRYKSEEPEFYIAGLIITGEIYKELKQGKLVEYYYNQALKNIESTRGSYNPEYTQLLSRLANLQFESGQFDVARENYLSLRLLWSNLMGDTYVNLSEVHYKLGLISLSQENLNEAFDDFVNAETVLRNHQPNYIRKLGDTYENLADISFRQERFELSESYAKQCIVIKNSSGEISLSKVYSIVGNIKLRQGKWEEARTNFENSLNQSLDQFGKFHIATFQANYDMARLFSQMKDEKNARNYLSEAGKIFGESLVSSFHFLPENARIQIYPVMKEFEKYFLGFHVQNPTNNQVSLAELVAFINASKHFVLNPYSRLESMVHVTGKNEIELAYEEWMKSKVAKSRIIFDMDKIPNTHLLSDSLGKVILIREKILKNGSAAINSILNKSPLSREYVFEHLTDYETVVESFRHKQNQDEIYYGFVLIDKSIQPSYQLLIVSKGKELETEGFERYYNNIKARNEDRDSYGMYFQPIAGLFNRNKTVYFSPAGIYNKISIHSLRHPDGKYLHEILDIRYIPGLNNLTEYKVEQTSQKQVVLVGDPDFNFSIDSIAQVSVPKLKDLRYFPVKGSSFEVSLVGNLLDEAEWYHTDYFRENAIEKYIVDSYNPAFFHISTHGFFYNQELSGIYHDPALKSGLLLTSGNFTIPEMNEMSSRHIVNPEDGFLSNYEICKLNLERTFVAFLSLSGSDYQSSNNFEGFGSLTKAMFTAGTHYQIMSLWEQDLTVKDEFIRLFYKEWLRSKDVRKAFNTTLEITRNNNNHPYYWGGYILTGK